MKKLLILSLFLLFSCAENEDNEEIINNNNETPFESTLVEFRDNVFNFGNVEAGFNNPIEVRIKARSSFNGDKLDFNIGHFNLETNECENVELISGDLCSIFITTPSIELAQSFEQTISLRYENEVVDSAIVRGKVTNSKPEEINYTIEDLSFDRKLITFNSAFDRFGNPISDLITVRSNKQALRSNNLIRSNFTFPFLEGKTIEVLGVETQLNQSQEEIDLVIDSLNYSDGKFTENITLEFENQSPVPLMDTLQEPCLETGLYEITCPVEVNSDSFFSLPSFTDFETPLDIRYRTTSSPTKGSLSDCIQNNRDLTCRYSPEVNEIEDVVFYYTANDGVTNGQEIKVTLEFNIDNPPTAFDKSYITDEDNETFVPLEGTTSGAITYRVLSFPSHGSLQGVSAGIATNPENVKYIPNENFFGTDQFSYRVTDGTFNSNVAIITIEVNPVNDRPTAEPLSISTDEDESVNFTLTYNDVEDDNLTFDIINSPNKGEIEGTPPNLTYVPFENENGSDSFTYSVVDSEGLDRNAVVSVEINPINDLPISQDQNLSMLEDESLNITLFGEDVETSLEDLTFNIVSIPSNGILSGTGNNITYTPNNNFFGNDQFSYQVVDEEGGMSEVGTIDINVDGVNDAPIANDYNKTLEAGEILNFTLNVNDLETDISNLNFTLLDNVNKGTLDNNFPDFTYTPGITAVGRETLTYQITDEGSLSADANISFYITNPDIDPMAENDNITLDEDQSKTITLIGTEGGEIAPNFDFEIVTPPSNGSLVGSPPNIGYTPNLNYNGSDSFEFKVINTYGIESNIGTISLNITPVNDAPLVTDANLETNEEESISFTLDYSDIEDDFADLIFNFTSTPIKGNISGTAPNFTYTPSLNEVGTEVITFEVEDTLGSKTTGEITIDIINVNDAPVAQDINIGVQEGGSTTFNLPVTDVETPSENLTFEMVDNPTKGNVVFNNNEATYQSSVNELGEDTFTFKATDPEGAESNIGTITITIDEMNRPPVINDQEVLTDEEVSVNFSLSYSDSLTPFEDLTFEFLNTPSKGSLSGTTPNFTYTPALNETGTDTINYRVTDPEGLSSDGEVVITIVNINDAPVADDESYNINEDETLVFTLSGTDIETSASGLLYKITELPAKGTLKDAQNNEVQIDTFINRSNLTYTPDLDNVAMDTFNFSVSDGEFTDIGTISISFNPVNDAPRPQEINETLDEDTPAIITLNAPDPDNDATDITYIIQSAPEIGELFENSQKIENYPHELSSNQVEYIPMENENGSDSFTYTAKDLELTGETNSVNLNINPVNDPPVAFLLEDIIIEINTSTGLDLNGEDPETSNEDLTFEIVDNPTKGVITSTGDGITDPIEFTYTANTDAIGPDSFSYKIIDPEGLESNIVTVDILIEVPLEPSLYFSSLGDDNNGNELRKWDTELQDMFLVKDFNVGSADSNIQKIKVLNKRIYLSVNDSSEGKGVELYRFSDVSSTNELLHDINPGSGSSNPSHFVKLKRKLYFMAFDGNQNNLYKFDPLDDSLTIINDHGINEWSNPVSLGQAIYFVAESSIDNKGFELYKYQDENISLVQDIKPGSTSSNPKHLLSLNGKLYFFYDEDTTNNVSHLFKYDPSTDNISPIGSKFWDLNKLTHMNNANNKIYFTGQEITFAPPLGNILLFNNTFDNNTNGWTTSSDVSVENQKLKIESSINDQFANIKLNLNPNVRHSIEFDFESKNNGIGSFKIFESGSLSDPSPAGNILFEEDYINSTQNIVGHFTPNSNEILLNLRDVTPEGIFAVNDIQNSQTLYTNFKSYIQKISGDVFLDDNNEGSIENIRFKVGSNVVFDIVEETTDLSPSFEYEDLILQPGETIEVEFYGSPSKGRIQSAGLKLLEGDSLFDNIVIREDPEYTPAPDTGSELWEYSLVDDTFTMKNDSLSSGTSGINLTSATSVDGNLFGFFDLPDNNLGLELYEFDPISDQYNLLKELVPGSGGSDGDNLVFIQDESFTFQPDQANFTITSSSVGNTHNFSVTFSPIIDVFDAVQVFEVDPHFNIDLNSSCLNDYPYMSGECSLEFSLKPSQTGNNQVFTLLVGPNYTDNLQEIKVTIQEVN